MAEEIKSYVDLTVVSFEGGKRLDGVTHQFIKPPPGRFSRYYTSPLHVRRIVRRVDPDIVHSHGDDWAVPSRYRMIRTFYGLSISEARASRGLRKWNHYLLALLEQLSAQRADVKLAIAPESFSAFKCDYLCPPVGNDVKISLKSKSTVPAAVFIGSFDGRKRGWMVQEAIQNAKAISPDATLTVIGPEDDGQHWEAWVDHKSGLSDEQVADEIARSWVLLAPSEYEGFGLPAFEALELRTHVVASSNPGTRYLKEVGGEALPLTVCSDQSFANEVSSLLESGGHTLKEAEVAACQHLSRQIRELSGASGLCSIYERV